MTEKVVLNIKLTIVEYRRGKTLVIKYDRPYLHVADTYQVVFESNRAIWENVATGNCILQLWLMMEPSEVHRVQPISHQ